MAPVVVGTEALRRLFAALTEQTFAVEFGVADPPLLDYLTDLLTRFARVEHIFRLRDATGRCLEDVAQMLAETETRTDRPHREYHRHIGDFTLFWAGVYPEALTQLQHSERCDHLIDYCEQGKRSYYIASTYDGDPFQEEAPVLRRLSIEFELCSYGLNRVRTEWEHMAASAGDLGRN